MPIRRSPNGARHVRPQPGRNRPERVVAVNRNAWSQSVGIGGRNHPVRAPIPKDRNIAALNDIAERIAISDDVVDWHRKGMEPNSKPERNPENISARRRSKRRLFLAESRSRESAQDDKWNFCLTAGTLCPANQERP